MQATCTGSSGSARLAAAAVPVAAREDALGAGVPECTFTRPRWERRDLTPIEITLRIPLSEEAEVGTR